MACLLLSTAAGAHVADVPTAAVVQHFSISAGDQGTETRCKQLPEKLALMTSTPGLTAEARRRRRCWSKGRYRGCQPKAEEHRVPLLRGTCKAWSTVRGRWPDRISHPSAPHATAGTLLPEICGLVYRSGPACRDTVTRTIVCSWVAASPPAVEWRPAILRPRLWPSRLREAWRKTFLCAILCDLPCQFACACSRARRATPTPQDGEKSNGSDDGAGPC